MLYNLLYPLAEHVKFFNVFKYITFRTAYATLTALVITLILGPMMIELLRRWKLGQITKGYEPERHKVKQGTPTMGGLMILAAAVISTLLWSDLRNPYVYIVVFVFIMFGLVGFWDDYIKTIKKNPEGLSARAKFLLQLITATIAVVLINWVDTSGNAYKLSMPFFKRIVVDLSWFYIPFALFVIVGTSNAVNLTDGLDGLAIMPSVIAFATFAVFTYIAGHANFAHYLNVFHVRGVGEITIFCGAMVGAGLGFLWYNAHPASVFMGDVGSLSIGGVLGLIAVMVKQEFMLLVVGGVFVMETVSVILQVGFFKMTSGKRLFRMAPIHHHFELKGWNETKIVVRFWIISFILALLALSTLKLR